MVNMYSVLVDQNQKKEQNESFLTMLKKLKIEKSIAKIIA